MGRMKVYGESWDLPGASRLDNPFSKYMNIDFKVGRRRDLKRPDKIWTTEIDQQSDIPTRLPVPEADKVCSP